MEYPVPDPSSVEQLFTNSIPATYVVWTDGATIYADPQDSDLSPYKGTSPSTVINDAIDECNSVLGSGKIVLAVDGTLEVFSPIVMKRGVRVEGMGWGDAGPTTVRQSDGADITEGVFTYSDAGGNIAGCGIGKLFIDGNEANNASGSGIYNDQDTGMYSIFSELQVKNCPDYGIYFRRGVEAEIYYSEIKNIGGEGIRIGTAGIGSQMVRILGNTLPDAGDPIIHFTNEGEGGRIVKSNIFANGMEPSGRAIILETSQKYRSTTTTLQAV